MYRTLLCTAALCAFLCGSEAGAQEKTTIRIADYLPTSHYIFQQGLKPWMEEVEKETGGKVAFQHFPAQQLGKSTDILKLTQTNVAQMGVTGVSFASDKMEMSDVAQLPGAFEKACEGTRALLKLGRSGPVADRDYKANGVRLLFPIVLPPFQIYSTTKAVAAAEDVRGMKIMVPTRSGELLLSQMGAAPVRLSSGPQAYEGITRGTVDALLFAADSIFAYDLQKTVKNMTVNGPFGGQAVVFVINEEIWNKLDRNVQDAIDKAGDRAANRLCEFVDQSSVQSTAKLVELGVKAASFSPAALKEFQTLTNKNADEWARELDSRGRPGQEVLRAFRDVTQKPTN